MGYATDPSSASWGMNPIHTHHSLCSFVVDLEMECNPLVSIAGVDEMDLADLTRKYLVFGDLLWTIGE